MQSPPADAHVTVLARRLGERVPIVDVADAEVRANVERLHREKVSTVRISTSSALELAVAVTPGAPGGPPACEPFDSVIVCTDSAVAVPPSDWAQEYQRRAGLTSTRASLVSGAACANFALGLDVCRGLIVSGAAERLLVVVVDVVSSGTRYTPVSQSVNGDGAVSCLVAATPSPGAFRVVGSATESRLPPSDESALAEARRTILAMSEAARRATSGHPIERFRHIVTLNLGETARRLMAMAAPVPAERLYSDRTAIDGHCFAADIPLSLQGIAASSQLSDGDLVLALTSGRHEFSALSFAYEGS